MTCCITQDTFPSCIVLIYSTQVGEVILLGGTTGACCGTYCISPSSHSPPPPNNPRTTDLRKLESQPQGEPNPGDSRLLRIFKGETKLLELTIYLITLVYLSFQQNCFRTFFLKVGFIFTIMHVIGIVTVWFAQY